MPGVVELADAVQIYKDLAGIPAITSAKVCTVQSDDGLVSIYSEWTQRDLERMEKTKYSRTTVLKKSGDGYQTISSSVPHELGTELWNMESPSGNLRAVVRKSKSRKGDDKFFIEIWSITRKLKTIDVTAADKHGDIYEPDGAFGSLDWSSSEGHLLYVAEKKRAKSMSYFDPKAEQASEDSDETPKGDENVFHEEWGELLVGKHQPVLCVLDVDTGCVSVLENVPEDISPGQALWVPDDSGVVFVGWSHEPFRLGITYCPIRSSAIYHIDFQSATCTVVGSLDQSVRNPIFSPDKTKLVFLQNPVGGPHIRCSQLVQCDWQTKCCSVIVDILHKPESEDFQGLFLLSLAPRCWMKDSARLVLQSYCRSKQELFIVNTDARSITRLTKDDKIGTWSLLDVHDDIIVASAASPSSPGKLVFGFLPGVGEERSIKWCSLDQEEAHLEDVCWTILKHHVPEGHVNRGKDGYYADLDYESVLLTPKGSDTPPLIIYPHGGPHSVFPSDYIVQTSGLCKCGFAVLLVNYRGSAGFGQWSVDSLPGNVGNQDVLDVYDAAMQVFESGVVDNKNVFVAGGSHGGFLTAHLIGQFPALSKAAVLRNPVINIASMLGTTDIPDWCLVECGISHDINKVPGKEAYTAAWDRSPIRYVGQVKTPSMLMIGAGDKRVPPKQGEEFYKALKVNRCEVRMLLYPENSHPLNKVDCEADCFVNIFKWFKDHM